MVKDDFQEIKIVDIGLNNYVYRNKHTLNGFRCIYLPPEILRDQPHSYKSALWSVGILAYTLLCGKPPLVIFILYYY